jgi:hypothetical protein
MTKEEIIEMAKIAKLPFDYETGVPMWLDKLEIFTKLVAGKEREACAEIADELQLHYAHDVAMEIRARKHND